MRGAPSVSIVMPVHNGEKFLYEAIESILNQVFRDYEFLIVDDGSTDGTAAILEHFQKIDPRIFVFHQENQGLIATLNKAFCIAHGEYIARMDADDISLPDRLSRQVEFMEKHPEVGICGTWIKTFGGPDEHIAQYPTSDAEIRCHLLFYSPMAHPSVMFRRAVIENANLSFNPIYKHAEDYELWIRASEFTEFANIPEILLLYREHYKQISQRYNQEQLLSSRQARLKLFMKMGLLPSSEEIRIHESFGQLMFQFTKDDLERTSVWLEKLKRANTNSKAFPEPAFANLLSRYWFTICSHNTEYGSWVWNTFWRSPLSSSISLNRLQRLKLRIKCALKRTSKSSNVFS